MLDKIDNMFSKDAQVKIRVIVFVLCALVVVSTNKGHISSHNLISRNTFTYLCAFDL